MPTYHTVVPLHHVYLKADTAVEFGAGLTFGPMPAWIYSEDQTLMKSLSEGDQEAIKQSRHAFAITYEAASLGDPDPENPGKSVQESKYELCVMANFALWLSKPSPLCFAIPSPSAARRARGRPGAGRRRSRSRPWPCCPCGPARSGRRAGWDRRRSRTAP